MWPTPSRHATRSLAGALCVALVALCARGAERPAFPIAVGPDGHHLVDARGAPFLIHGDTPWSITHNLTFEEAVLYMETRRAQGFNTLMVSVPDAYDADGNKAYNPDRYGQQPFEGRDLTRPNEAYWAHVDRVFAKAEQMGFLLLVTPAYLGADHDGYVDWLKEAGAARCRQYGLWIGRRYRERGNIVWVHGGDRNPWDVRDEVRALAQAIREVDDVHLHTAHWANGTSAFDYFGDEGWLDFNSSYTYGPVAWRILSDRAHVPARPTFLIETHYENDFGGRTAEDVRAYPYRAILSGAAGHMFGNKPLWYCGHGWEEALHSKGAEYMQHALALFRSRPWWQLEPDRTHQVVVEGHWESGADEGVQAALTSDGGTLIAYLPPARRRVLVDLERLSGVAAQAWWFDPRTGQASSDETFRSSGSRAFTAPGEGDMVLVVDDVAKKYPPPGSVTR
jgi:Protein of unknown function (DUF4038)/Putative collagen-binding domain of a collagenase